MVGLQLCRHLNTRRQFLFNALYDPEPPKLISYKGCDAVERFDLTGGSVNSSTDDEGK